MLELLFVVPVLLIILSFLFEFGFQTYNFLTINYTLTQSAIDAAKEGSFNNAIRNDIAAQLQQYTIDGHELSYDTTALNSYEDSNTIVVWGTDPSTQVQFNDPIQIGVVYPVQFKTFLFDDLVWVVQDHQFYFNLSTTSSSEVYIE